MDCADRCYWKVALGQMKGGKSWEAVFISNKNPSPTQFDCRCGRRLLPPFPDWPTPENGFPPLNDSATTLFCSINGGEVHQVWSSEENTYFFSPSLSSLATLLLGGRRERGDPGRPRCCYGFFACPAPPRCKPRIRRRAGQQSLPRLVRVKAAAAGRSFSA